VEEGRRRRRRRRSRFVLCKDEGSFIAIKETLKEHGYSKQSDECGGRWARPRNAGRVAGFIIINFIEHAADILEFTPRGCLKGSGFNFTIEKQRQDPRGLSHPGGKTQA